MADERDERGSEIERRHVKRMPPRPHPKPEPGQPASLNHAVRQELWYIDTMMAAPFRTLRRLVLGSGKSPLAEGVDEMLWAWEGMSRLPVKLLQAAFGEELGPPKSTPEAGAGPGPNGGGRAPAG